jgi:type II secretory pathway pseudopilin PulG
MLTRRRGGAFTLIEIVIALAIIALIGAVMVASVGGRIGESRAAAVASTLSAINDGLVQYRADVRRYPKNLTLLTTAPAFGVTDLCNQTVPQTFINAWRGPYLKAVVLATGIKVEEMTVNDALELSPVGPYTATSNGALVIVVTDVDSTVARELETRFDGNADFTAGTIRFTHVLSGQGTMRFATPVRGC